MKNNKTKQFILEVSIYRCSIGNMINLKIKNLPDEFGINRSSLCPSILSIPREPANTDPNLTLLTKHCPRRPHTTYLTHSRRPAVSGVQKPEDNSTSKSVRNVLRKRTQRFHFKCGASQWFFRKRNVSVLKTREFDTRRPCLCCFVTSHRQPRMWLKQRQTGG